MKERSRGLWLLAAVVVLCLAVPSVVQAQLGVTAGFNFDRLTDVKLNSLDANFESQTGWHIGAWYDFSLGVISIRPGVRYMQAGALFTGLSEIDAQDVQDDFDINLVEVPILMRLGFGAPAIKPYVLAGPVIRLTAGVNNIIDNDLKSPSVAGEVGFGVELGLGVVRLYPEIAFTFGLSDFVEDELIIGTAILTADKRSRLNTAMLRLGVGL